MRRRVRRPALDPDRRPNGLQKTISEQLRIEVRQGRFPPGTRLPRHVELQARFKTTPATVQAALDKLAADGFIRTAGRGGTFVTDYPPCLTRYALVFPGPLNAAAPGINFWKVLARLAKARNGSEPRRFLFYTSLNGHTDEPDYVRLRHDVRDQLLAGVLFAANPYALANTPLLGEMLAQPSLPKVAFMTKPSYPEIPAVAAAELDSLTAPLDCFRKRGCRRLAVLNMATGEGDHGGPDASTEGRLVAAAASRGLEIRPYWLQAVAGSAAVRSRQLVHLLLQGPPEQRPDALWITDDCLVPAATAGIVDAGVRVPQELAVVAHCNYPEPPAAAVPVIWHGLAVGQVLDTCLALLEQQRLGQAVPRLTTAAFQLRIPAVMSRPVTETSR